MKNLLLFPIDEDDITPASKDKAADAQPTGEKRSKNAAKKPRRKKVKSPERNQRLLEDLELPKIESLSDPEAKRGDLAPVSDEMPSAENRSAGSSLVPSPLVVPVVSADAAVQLPPIENRLIRASAGTGKTYQLTSRYLRLLLLGAPPETILATTFTRKAAGEILDRIVMWLGKAATDPGELRNLAQAVEISGLTQQECRAKLGSLTRQMHRLRIYTIDAFFMQMALSFSLELGMTPGWQILEEGGPESSTLRNQAIAGVLRHESLEDLLVLVHQLTPKGEAKRALDGMLKGRVNDAYRLFLNSTSDAWDRLKVSAPLPQDELDDVRDALMNFKDKRSSILKAIQSDVNRIINEDWRGFFDSGTTLVRNINEGKEKYGNAKITPELIAVYRRFLPHLRSMILQAASAQTKGTYDFLEKYHEQYRAIKDNQRLYSFDEVTDLLSRQAKSGDLAEFSFRMDAGIDHLLLDEFQDTSIPQWRAFAKLADHCTADEPNRSFFCVGDVKQAIYGWRGGSSEIFDVLDKRLPNLRNSELQESRRSSQIIIDAVNQVFELLPTWDPKKLGRAKRAVTRWEFPKHTTHLRDVPGYFTIETSDVAGYDKLSQEEAVLRRAAERVASITKQAKGRTIGVLCRRNDKVGQMMNWLQRLGVPASEEGGNFLTDSAAVELVLSLLHLTDHPGDSIAAYHLAASPWGDALGLKVNVCNEYSWAKDESKPDNESRPRPPAGIDPKSINTLVRTVRRHLLESGFGDTIQAWAEQLRPFCNRREARRLAQLVEQAYAYQNTIESPTQMGYQRQRRQSIRPTELVRFIRETKVTDPSNATIRVMTVHQAKGLEFDIVVLPDLLGPFVEGHDTFLYRRPSIESDMDLVCRYMGKDSGRSFLPNEFLPLFDEFEDRKARESFCVLYVAMTRAVHALHIFLPCGMQKLKMAKGHAGYLIKDAFSPGVGLEPSTTVHAAGDKHWFMNDPKFASTVDDDAPFAVPSPRLAKPRPQMRGFETVAPSQIGANRYVRLRDRLAQRGNEAKDYGTLIHAWLSQITWLGGDADFPANAQIRAIAEPYADRLDVDAARKTFLEMLKNEPLSEILNEQPYMADLHKSIPGLSPDLEIELRLEQPVASRDDNQIITGTIDRLVLAREAGKIVAAEIIDYKTDLDGSMDSDAKRKKTDRYESQMAAYRRVISSSLRIENVTSRLVFL